MDDINSNQALYSDFMVYKDNRNSKIGSSVLLLLALILFFAFFLSFKLLNSSTELEDYYGVLPTNEIENAVIGKTYSTEVGVLFSIDKTDEEYTVKLNIPGKNPQEIMVQTQAEAYSEILSASHNYEIEKTLQYH